MYHQPMDVVHKESGMYISIYGSVAIDWPPQNTISLMHSAQNQLSVNALGSPCYMKAAHGIGQFALFM